MQVCTMHATLLSTLDPHPYISLTCHSNCHFDIDSSRDQGKLAKYFASAKLTLWSAQNQVIVYKKTSQLRNLLLRTCVFVVTSQFLLVTRQFLVTACHSYLCSAAFVLLLNKLATHFNNPLYTHHSSDSIILGHPYTRPDKYFQKDILQLSI